LPDASHGIKFSTLLALVRGASTESHLTTRKPSLAALVASNEFIARIDAVGKSLRAESQLRLLDRYDGILKETQELIRVVEQEMQDRQAALLTTRGAEVKDLYDRLNRGANRLHGARHGLDETARIKFRYSHVGGCQFE
jgi:hypothetical protein